MTHSSCVLVHTYFTENFEPVPRKSGSVLEACILSSVACMYGTMHLLGKPGSSCFIVRCQCLVSYFNISIYKDVSHHGQNILKCLKIPEKEYFPFLLHLEMCLPKNPEKLHPWIYCQHGNLFSIYQYQKRFE